MNQDAAILHISPVMNRGTAIDLQRSNAVFISDTRSAACSGEDSLSGEYSLGAMTWEEATKTIKG